MPGAQDSIVEIGWCFPIAVDRYIADGPMPTYSRKLRGPYLAWHRPAAVIRRSANCEMPIHIAYPKKWFFSGPASSTTRQLLGITFPCWGAASFPPGSPQHGKPHASPMWLAASRNVRIASPDSLISPGSRSSCASSGMIRLAASSQRPPFPPPCPH